MELRFGRISHALIAIFFTVYFCINIPNMSGLVELVSVVWMVLSMYLLSRQLFKRVPIHEHTLLNTYRIVYFGSPISNHEDRQQYNLRHPVGDVMMSMAMTCIPMSLMSFRYIMSVG
jgi:hypothetical protein